jgi:hypothetical protein
MAVADITNPKVTQDYTTLLASIRDLFISQAALHDATGIVGLTAGAIRYSGANTRFEKFDGTTWNALTVSISGNSANVTGIVAGANGGTGVANTGKTLTLGGNLALAGAFNSTFTMTGATGVTFPTSGTLLSTATAVTVAQGGTGATTAAGALVALGAVNRAGDTMSGPNTPLTINSTNASIPKIVLAAAGTTQGYIASDATYAFRVIDSANATYVLSVSNAGLLSAPSISALSIVANGTGTPLFVSSSNSAPIKIVLQDNGTTRGYIAADATYPFRAVNAANSAYVMSVDNSGNLSAVTVTQTSDERKKKKWQRLPSDFIAQLAGIKRSGLFQWKKDGSIGLGVGAQSLEAFLSAAVHTDAKGNKTVNYGAAAMVSAVELARKVGELEARLAALEAA